MNLLLTTNDVEEIVVANNITNWNCYITPLLFFGIVSYEMLKRTPWNKFVNLKMNFVSSSWNVKTI